MKIKFILLISILILAISNLLQAGDSDETSEIEAKLNALQGTSNAGREYLFSIPPPYDAESGGFDNFIRIFVVSPVVTNVKVGISGSYKTFKTLGNGLTVIDFPAYNVLPFKHIATATQPAAKIYKDKSIHFVADEPVIVYCIVRFKYTTDGFLAIPTTSLGKEYAIASQPQWGGGFGYKLTPFVNITAAYDKTKVNFTMGGGKVQSYTEIEGGVLLGTGQSKSYNLNKGETLVFCASSKNSKGDTLNGEGQDLAGSLVSSNRPIAVVTGHPCSNIPISNNYCDYLAEMELPTTTWGKNIIVPNLPDRKKAGIIRLFGKADETDIFRNNNYFKSIAKTIGAEGESFISERVWPYDSIPRPAVFTSNKTFNAVFFNPGQVEDNITSDPFSMNLIPIEQYQNDMYLCTPNAAGGDPFNKNWLNIVIEADENGFIPDDFEFGTFSSDWQWQKVRNMNGPIDNSLPKFKMENNPSNPLVKYLIKNIALPFSGVFRLRCKSKKFTSYSYGYGYYEAYGYPTGSAMKDLTTQDIYKPIPTYTIECDGEYGMAIKYGKVLDPIINNNPSTQSKLSDTYMKRNESYNYDFKVLSEITPWETDLTSWSLTKINPRADARAVLYFADVAGNDTTIIIEDFATNLALNKDEYFGEFKINEPSVSRTFTVTNNSKKKVEIHDLKLKRGNEGFTIEPLNWNKSLPLQIGETREIIIQFSPLNTFPRGKLQCIDSLGVGDSCEFKYMIELKAKLDSISSDVSEEFINNIEISTKGNSIYINNVNQELLSFRLSDLQGKIISTSVLNSTNEITLKEQSAQTLIIEIINKESKVLIRKKLILER